MQQRGALRGGAYVEFAARSVLLGGGLAFAWSDWNWHHTPLVFLNPYAYVAYQVFVSKEQVIRWTKNEFGVSSSDTPPV